MPAVRALQTLGAPVLRKAAKIVPPAMIGTKELDDLVQDMIDTMRHANGAGIAAPQIGEPWRVFVVHGTGDNPRYPYKPAIPLTVFVNPVIDVLDETPMHIIEGCLSVPNMRGEVSRACKVRCTAQSPDGQTFSVRAEGHAAGTLQHELDHLDAKLFPDITFPGRLMTGDSFDKYEKEEFFKYANGISRLYPNALIWEEEGDSSVPGAAFVSAEPAVLTSEETIYEAELTWTGSKFERGVQVVVGQDGRIRRVSSSPSLKTASIKAMGQALIPGFVNAHSHAFQRGLRGLGENYPRGPSGEETPSFWTWREAMYGLVNELDSVEAFKRQTKQCFQEMAAAGITTCGEFHYFRHSNGADGEEDFSMDQAVIEAAREANVRLVLLSACYERGGFDGSPLNTGQRRFRTLDLDRYWKQMERLSSRLDASRGEALGVVVHSLRAVGMDSLTALAAEARRRRMPLHVHLEEQPQEIQDCMDTHGVTPLALLLRSLPSEDLERLCAVHCTHSRPNELEQLIAAGAGVCICPLTEASLGDGVFLSLEPTGGVVSLGTDCNARIDMFEEMRWLEYSQRLHRGRRGVFSSVANDEHGDLQRQLLDCATVHGAAHLGVDTGAIADGKWADFALIDLEAPALAGSTDTHVLGAAIFGGCGEGLIVDTCVGGTWSGNALKI